ncbi:MAG: LTA synthase family protein [Nitrospiraceae bacterium]|nr:LTA synthase family protein [Nitrospiraceae bacterium]
MTRWQRFFSQYQKDAKLWLYFMAVLSLFRVLFILYFRSKIVPGNGGEVWRALANGMRFDAMAAGYWVALPALLSAACAAVDIQKTADRVRNGFGLAFSIITPLIYIITLVYFGEYNDHFNHFIFNLYYDDTRAIATTIWSGYHPVRNLLLAGVLGYGLVRLYRKYREGRFFKHDIAAGLALPFLAKALLTVVAVLLLAGSIRGSFGHRPAKLEDVGVTRDPFLNKAVLNPYNALNYAWAAHRKLGAISSGLNAFIPDGNVRTALIETFGEKHGAKTLDDHLERTASGSRNAPPKHVFLVVMESYDAWPLMAKYASLGITNELGRIAQEGVQVTNFLPASDGTATSLTAIVSGLADANVITNYQPSSAKPYPTSLPAAFKRLGFRTRFFYGGNLSWQKIGDFMTGQGFDEVYGGANIDRAAIRTEWGVEDEALFAFIESTVEKQRDVPSLNVIMTTSYHPPYDLDVHGKGFPLREKPADLAPLFDGTTTLAMLGHLWYSDRCIGAFVREAEKKLPRPLFAFTGDHFGRKFLNDHPPAFESAAVPFILYGKDVLRGVRLPADAAGSHIDIAPTLIELAAPKGFQYAALGRNILSPDRDPLGFSRDWVISSRYLLDARTLQYSPLPGRELPANLPIPAELKAMHDRIQGISWWRIMRGPELRK